MFLPGLARPCSLRALTENATDLSVLVPLLGSPRPTPLRQSPRNDCAAVIVQQEAALLSLPAAPGREKGKGQAVDAANVVGG